MNNLSPVPQKFVLHWGEMGTRWGINRTVAQIHALLYISQKPLNAEQIAETLGVARSNVSTSLKELQGWGIVKLVHLPGDKRDHFDSMKDVWEMFRVVLDERKRREIDPTLTLLRECIAEAEKEKETDAYTEERLKAFLGVCVGFLVLFGFGDALAQQGQRGINLAPLPFIQHDAKHLPHVLHRIEMVAFIARQMDQFHDSPPLQLFQACADVRP